MSRVEKNGKMLAAELRQTARLHAAIAACAERFAETRDLFEILKSAVPVIRKHIGLDRVGIFLYDARLRHWRGVYGVDDQGNLRDERNISITDNPRTPISRVLAGEADEFFIEDFSVEFPDEKDMRGVKNNFFLALRAHGRLLGCLSVDNLLTQRPIDEKTREDLRRFARYIALAIENLQLLERLEIQNQELNRANTDLQEFAYVVSHDLKAPLRGIASLAQWLTEDYGPALGPEGAEQLELLVARSRRMQGLIDGILHYCQLGRAQIKNSVICVKDVVGRVVDALAPPSSVLIHIDGGFPSVVYNRIQLEQVFQNLIGNAIAHMGKPAGEVWITAHEQPGQWEFRVRDTGVGIDGSQHKRIFKIFQTLKSKDESENTGIGLAVVKKIVESNGGKVWVTSKVNEGSTFGFTVLKVVQPHPVPSADGR